jgi:hypothetical protein
MIPIQRKVLLHKPPSFQEGGEEGRSLDLDRIKRPKLAPPIPTLDMSGIGGGFPKVVSPQPMPHLLPREELKKQLHSQGHNPNGRVNQP